MSLKPTEVHLHGAAMYIFQGAYAVLVSGALCAGVAAGIVETGWAVRALFLVLLVTALVHLFLATFCLVSVLAAPETRSAVSVDDVRKNIREFRLPRVPGE